MRVQSASFLLLPVGAPRSLGVSYGVCTSFRGCAAVPGLRLPAKPPGDLFRTAGVAVLADHPSACSLRCGQCIGVVRFQELILFHNVSMLLVGGHDGARAE